MKEIVEDIDLDEDLTRLKENLHTRIWFKEQNLYKVIEDEIGVVDGVILRGAKIVLPKNL